MIQKRIFSGLALWLLLIGGACLISSAQAAAQVFNCTVQLNDSKLAGSDFSFLSELEVGVERYLNDYAWTDDRYQQHERIECQVSIFMEEAISLTSFRARLIISSRRPIYGTTQNTNVAQFSDEAWAFEYTQGTPLNHDLNRYDPLTSLLDFYAFILLGYDYDTFSEFGGTPYFEQARGVADQAQASGAAGWDQIGDDQTRISLVEQLLEPRFRPLRQAYFDYHFGGLDQFTTDIEEARQTVYASLQQLDELAENISRAYVLDLFFGTKADELIAIFEESEMSSDAYDILSRIDPARLSTYNTLLN